MVFPSYLPVWSQEACLCFSFWAFNRLPNPKNATFGSLNSGLRFLQSCPPRLHCCSVAAFRLSLCHAWRTREAWIASSRTSSATAGRGDNPAGDSAGEFLLEPWDDRQAHHASRQVQTCSLVSTRRDLQPLAVNLDFCSSFSTLFFFYPPVV